MAKKSKKPRTPKESIYWGDSKDLKYYLTTKRKSLARIWKEKKDELSNKQKSKLKKYIDLLEDILRLKYFDGRRHYTMSEMIEEIKLERADVKVIVEKLEKETAEAKKIADEAFKREKCYVANSFEDAYNTDGQKELRDLIAEYDVCQMELDSYKLQYRALWWLLGVIHRPVGFFEKVMEEWFFEWY